MSTYAYTRENLQPHRLKKIDKANCRLTDKKSRFPIIVDESAKYKEERMLNGQVLEIGGAVVVDDDLAVVSASEYVLALPGGDEIGEGGLSELEPPSVESVRAVDIDGAANVVDVVDDERPTVEEDETGLALQSSRQFVGVDGARALEDQLTLEGAVALGARTARQADGLQLATFRWRAE